MTLENAVKLKEVGPREVLRASGPGPCPQRGLWEPSFSLCPAPDRLLTLTQASSIANHHLPQGLTRTELMQALCPPKL